MYRSIIPKMTSFLSSTTKEDSQSSDTTFISTITSNDLSTVTEDNTTADHDADSKYLTILSEHFTLLQARKDDGKIKNNV